MRKELIVTLLAGAFLAAGSARAMAQATLEVDTNRYGSDLGSIDTGMPSPIRCQEACINDPRCHAWTYVRPGAFGNPPDVYGCWLKYKIPPATRNTCCVSGIVRPDR